MEAVGFYIGDFFVAYYGLMIVLGLLAAAGVGFYQVKRFGKDFNDFIIIAATAGLFGLLGAKLLYLIVSLDKIDFSRLTDPAYLNSLLTGGFVFYGGLIGGIGGLLLCQKSFGLDVGQYLKIGVPCLPIVHGFGRIGCSLVGCCYGRPYSGIGGVLYLHSLYAPNGQSLFPVQAVEAFFNIIIAVILLIYINKFSGKYGVELYLCFYAVMRFLLEFARYDSTERGMIAGLSTSQYISILILLGVAGYRIWKKKTTHTP